uniref:H15 domain-containing protein n=1 Tax=Kryptolebias marmoratus TaxID=37003 RepID=A0A3Q3G067_KRYMA
MAEEAPAAAPAKAPAKAPRKKAAPKAKKEGPSLQKLIVAAVADSKERKGVSLSALKKVLAGKGVDVSKANKRINTAVTKLVTKGSLSQTKGTGASGSFKLEAQKYSESAPTITEVQHIFIVR